MRALLAPRTLREIVRPRRTPGAGAGPIASPPEAWHV
jgi:hypothetical protein